MEKNAVLMTKYFYPIQEGGTEEFFGGIYFDNPRTEKEIKYVANVLKNINKKSKCPEKDSDNETPWLSIEYVINKFCKKNIAKKEVAEYSDNILKDNNIYLSLAKMWVIVRCDKILVESDKDKCAYPDGFEKEVDAFHNLVNFERIKKTLMFLSFIVQQDYEGIHKSILVTDGRGCIIGNHSFAEFIYGLYTLKQSLDKDASFDHFSGILNKYNKYIDLISDRYNDDKFIFICETIENISELQIKSEKMYLLGIVGLIEMLLTHNPDTSKYNVEDSISKQYIRKLKYVLYKKFKDVDLKELENELKISYGVRSDIAHGNFGKDSEKKIDKLFDMYGYDKNSKGVDYLGPYIVIDKLNINLTKYAKILLDMYLRDPIGLDLLKDL